MSTTDILQKNILDLPSLGSVSPRTWMELERNSSSFRESMDGLRYTWLTLSANDFVADAGASLNRIDRYSYATFPNSTASGDPAVYASIYPARLLPSEPVDLIQYWGFTTAATGGQARMVLALEWPNGNSFDLSVNGPDASTNEQFNLVGSSAVDGLVMRQDSNLLDNPAVGSGWSYVSVAIRRDAGNAGDTLTIPLNLMMVQLRLGTTSS